MDFNETHKLDDLGWIVIPTGMRSALEWGERETLTISLDRANDAVVLRRLGVSCSCCGGTEQVRTLPNGRGLCDACWENSR